MDALGLPVSVASHVDAIRGRADTGMRRFAPELVDELCRLPAKP